MQNKELRDFVAAIIKEKNLQGVSQEIQDKLIDDLTGRLGDQINRALIDQLNDDQFKEFSQLVDDGNTEALSTYFNDKGINVTETVTKVMARFRISYLGS